ncbi:Uncharacterised protein [Mycobacterium tuberculosis]|nr:Uncharacterised protein [Mycobacterium tuberculosis]
MTFRAAHPIAAFEHQHLVTLSRQLAGRGQPGEARAHHDNIDSPRWVCHRSSQPHFGGSGRLFRLPSFSGRFPAGAQEPWTRECG